MKFNNVDKVISIRNITREGYHLSWIHYHVLLITKCMQHRTCLALPCHLEYLTYSKEQCPFIYQ